MTGARRVAPWGLAIGAYAALAVAVTWPLVLRLSSVVPHDLGDPLLNTWILWWDAHAIPLTTRWWDAPIFWPVHGAMGLSEQLIGLSLVATPLQWAGGSAVTAYNVLFLLSFPLSALSAHALAYHLTRRHDAATVAALVFGFAPFRAVHLSHLQMLSSYWIPVALLALHCFLGDRRRRWLVVFGAAWLLQALCNGYYLLFFPVLIALWIAWFVRFRDGGRPLLAITGAWVIASLPLAPILWTYRSIHADLHLHRTLAEIATFAADVESFATIPRQLRMWKWAAVSGPSETEIFPGVTVIIVVTMFAVIRLVSGPRPSRARASAVLIALSIVAALIASSVSIIGPWKVSIAGVVFVSVATIAKPVSIAILLLAIGLAVEPRVAAAWKNCSPLPFYLIAAVAMYVLSLGPQPRLFGIPFLYDAPYRMLLHMPGYDSIRVPARFAMLAVLCLACATALAMARLTARATPTRRRIAAGVIIAGLLVDGWPDVPLRELPPSMPDIGHDNRDEPMIELPLGYIENDAAAMYRGMFHGHPLVNGYSGYAPLYYASLTRSLMLDESDALQQLAGGSPLIVVINREDEGDRWTRVATAAGGQIIAERGRWRIVRLAPPLPARRAAGAALEVESFRSNVGNETIGHIADGDRTTAWNSRREQRGDEEIEIDLGRERHVTELRLELGPFVSDYPRRLAIDCSGDREEWRECWRGSAAALMVRGLLDEPAAAPIRIALDRAGTRRIRLRQTGADPANGWSIAELMVLGR